MSPKHVDKLKKIKYKGFRLQGDSIAKSLRKAGYSEGHARRSSSNVIVKDSEKELINSFNAKNITVDWVIEQLTSELTAPDAKASDRIRVKELLGKYLNMFRDNNIQQTAIFLDLKAIEDAKTVIGQVDVNTTTAGTGT